MVTNRLIVLLGLAVVTVLTTGGVLLAYAHQPVEQPQGRRPRVACAYDWCTATTSQRATSSAQAGGFDFTKLPLFGTLASRLGQTAAGTAAAPGLTNLNTSGLHVPTYAAPSVSPSAGTAQTSAPSSTLSFTSLQDVNYFPAQNGWSYMWTNWDPTIIDSDFATLSALGANSIRLVISAYTVYGFYPTPSPTYLSEIAQAVTLAHNHHLQVVMTLFDFWSTYSDVAGSKAWVDAIVGPFKNDSRVAYIDVHNESNTHDSTQTTWLNTIVPYVRSTAGTVPVTFSVTNTSSYSLAQMISNITTPVDLYDVHYYTYAPKAYTIFKQLKAAAGSTPIYVNETGTGTSLASGVNTRTPAGLQKNTTSYEAYQDQHFRTVQYALQALGLPIASPWINTDFNSASALLGYGGPDEGYGMYRLDGTIRPYGTTMSHIWQGNAIDLSFNNGFESLDDGGWPTLWRQYSGTGYTATFATDGTTAHGGSHSVSLANTTGTGTSIPAIYLSPIKYTVPSQSYTATVWAKGSVASGTTDVGLYWYDLNDNLISYTRSPALPAGTTSWTQLSVTAAAPANTAYVEIHLESASNSGTVWFDDVTFQ